MSKTESAPALFQEIFDSSSVLDSVAPVLHGKQEPQLPTDDPLWAYERVADGRTAAGIEDAEFIKTISGHETVCSTGVAQPAINAGIEFLKLVQAANARNDKMNKRAGGLTRQDLSSRMSKYYRHGLWRAWERMMTGCIGDPEFNEAKALSFLEVA